MTAKRIYFFAGTQYTRYDTTPSLVSTVSSIGYPADIATWWPGLPAGPIDAALNWGVNKVFFFAGNQYYRWNVLGNRVDPGYPKPIAGNWAGFAGTGFENGIDGAVNWGNGRVYFFKGNQYLRLSGPNWTVDPGYPKSLSLWNGFTANGFDSGIDDVVNYGNGKAYFFKGDQYLKYDLATDTTDAGYPKPIAGNWDGVFGAGISAAVEWPYAQLATNGFQVPTNRSGCVQIADTRPTAPPGNRRSGESFTMNLDFVDTPYPASLPMGEYRQYVRGQFTINGAAILHWLAPPTGSAMTVPVVQMRPIPADGNLVENFDEDGKRFPGQYDIHYGDRAAPYANGIATDQYLPDRILGSQYRGFDFPGIPGQPGTTYTVNLDFRGEAIDRGMSGLTLKSTNWSVRCAGTL